MQKLSNQEALRKSKEIWGNRYDYTKFYYVNARNPITLICYKHGEFSQKFHTHLRSECPSCAFESKRNSNEKIISDFIKIHGLKYDYSKTNYENLRKKIIVSCKKHGDFEINPNNHKNGRGCKRII